jgi:hypothetical protein
MLAEAESGGNARTLLQSLMNSLNMHLALHDIDSARERMTRVEELSDLWQGQPRQMGAWVDMARAGIAIQSGELDAAGGHLRAAADAAFASYDLPVIAHLAVTAGTLAAARGDLALALRAVDLAAAVAGIRESTNPQIADIEAAALNAGVERPVTDVIDRSTALEQLKELTA